MKAVVLEKTGDPNVLKIKDIDVPKVKDGWVLVKVKAFGINRSEILTRGGFSPSVKLPRILGIECVGEIYHKSDSNFNVGDKVVSLMGGLGRDFDGSYAEFVLIPSNQVYPIKSSLDWVTVGAMPETYSTAYGSLFNSLRLKSSDTLLIRGGTSSVGIAAIQLAKSIGTTVVATTRKEDKIKFLKSIGANFVLIDDGNLVDKVKTIYPNGVTKILELVGAPTLKSSLKLLTNDGVVCMTGVLGGWELDTFEPLVDMSSGTYLTIFESSVVDLSLLTDLYKHIEKYELKPIIAKVFKLDEIVEAHSYMEENIANGKIVIEV